jgi:GNAT superfamily N-acetyltransferase
MISIIYQYFIYKFIWMTILPYIPSFQSACLGIFESNKPKYFHEDERPLFINFLNRTAPEHYWIVRWNERMVACGGIYEDDIDVAGLAWGMVHRDYQGKGIGREFTGFRIQKMREVFPGHRYKIDTSQHTRLFYEKLGFRISHVIKDGFGLGLDKIVMWLD